MPDNQYDIIVIGSGPGGASLAQRLAPTGKKILLSSVEIICRVAKKTGIPKPCLSMARIRQPKPGTIPPAKPFILACIILSVEIQKSMAQPCSACANGILRRPAMKTASPPPGP